MKRNIFKTAFAFIILSITMAMSPKDLPFSQLDDSYTNIADAELTVQNGSPLVFWTSNCNYDSIEIYVNNIYQGNLTKCYNGAPQCAAEGCVTVIIKGTNNTWRAQNR